MDSIYAYGSTYKMIVAHSLGASRGVISGDLVCIADQGSEAANALLALELVRRRVWMRAVTVAVATVAAAWALAVIVAS